MEICNFSKPGGVRSKAKRHNFDDLGVSQMALLMPETKNGDHFYSPNYPPKPRKNHLCNTFWPLESGILAILHILHIFGSFLEGKMGVFFKPVSTHEKLIQDF